MERVLQVFGEPLANGGQEAFIMNVYKNVDRNMISFDFYTPFGCVNTELRDTVKSMGGNVFEDNGAFLNEGSKRDFVMSLRAFLDTHKYKTVHIHSGSIFALCMGAKLARESGAEKVIVHSHSTGTDNLKHSVIKTLSAPLFKKYATHFCACSKIAGEWKFPRSVNIEIIPNGIDTDKFSFSEQTRNEYRAMLGVQDDFVITHVGRLSQEKNHPFLLELVKRITIPNIKLILVGDGPEKESISALIKQYGISDKVIMLGVRTDISEILQASDVFLFPSLYEGLGIAVIEAQSTGLKTLCSKAVPTEASLTDICHRLPLVPDEWLCSIQPTPIENRGRYADILTQKQYTAKSAADKLTKIYLEN